MTHRLGRWAVALVLRSPAHPMLSGSILLLTLTGRRTGREYTLPVMYARHRSCLVLFPAHPQAKQWWRNLQGGAPVHLLVAGQATNGWATVAQGATAEAPLDSYVERFPRAAAATRELPLVVLVDLSRE